MRKTAHALAVPVVLLLAAGIAACGGEVPVGSTPGAPTSGAQETPGGATPTPQQTPGGGDTASGLTLGVGDCFNYDDTNPSSDIEMLSCDSSHMYEVYSLSDIDDKKYSTVPTDDDFATEASNVCYDPFETYVGVPYFSSSYSATYLYPTSSSWVQGDRTIYCLITSQDGKPLTGSARNTNK